MKRTISTVAATVIVVAAAAFGIGRASNSSDGGSARAASEGDHRHEAAW